MANYSTLKAAVADVVKTNGTQAITGANLQAVLLSIINSVGGGGYIFKGVATPSTDAGTPDENVFYLGGAGTYANFGTSVTVPVGSICVFKYNGSWVKEQIKMFDGIDDVPTAGSDNLITSGGADNGIKNVAYTFDWVNVREQTITTGTELDVNFAIPKIKGNVYFRVGISIDYVNTMYMPAVYVLYEGDSTYTSLGSKVPSVFKITTDRYIERVRLFLGAANANWSGTYYLDVCTDMSQRLLDTFTIRPINVECNISGCRAFGNAGGEYYPAPDNSLMMTPMLNVGTGKVKSYHHVVTNIPWLFVYKTDGTTDFYITNTPNENPTGVNRNEESEIVLPSNVAAIQFQLRAATANSYRQYIPDNLASFDIYASNRIDYFSDKFTNPNYVWNFGNEENGASAFYTTDYIEASENDYIEIGVGVSSSTNLNMPRCTIGAAYFDENYTIIGSEIRSTETTAIERIYRYKKVPTGTKYVRFGNRVGSVSVPFAAIHRGSMIDIQTGVNDDAPTIPVTYDISGKNIVLFGDSITQGESSTNAMNNSYAGILRKMFACEHGGNINYGFEHFATSSEIGYMTSLVSYTNWTRDYGNSHVLGGDRYSTSTANALLKFKINQSCNYIKICSEYDTSFGVLQVENNNAVLATIDLSAETKIGTSSLIDVSDCDFTKDFVLRCVSGTVNASGIVVIDNTDWWTFNNYGRSGAKASVFTGDLFDAQADGASVLIYALGVNSTWYEFVNDVESIKEQFKAVNAVKVVLDVGNYSSARITNSLPKKALIRQLADYVGAKYICVGDHYPKGSNGDAITGFFADDNVHPTDAGHQFIAELIAKNIGLSVNAKELAAKLYDE